MIKYHTEGSVCRFENIKLDRLKTRLNLYEIEDDIEEDREGRSKDKMNETFVIKTVPNCKNDLKSLMHQDGYNNCE